MELVKEAIRRDIEEFKSDYQENSNSPQTITDYISDCLSDYGFIVVANEDAAYEYCQDNTSHKTEFSQGEFWGSYFVKTEEVDNDVKYDSFDIDIFGGKYKVTKAECEGVCCYYVEHKNTKQNERQGRKRA